MTNNSSGTNTSGNLFQTSLNTNGVVYSASGGVISSTSAGASASTVLIGNGNSSAPTFSASPQLTSLGIGATAGASGITFDGTNLLTAYSAGSWTPIDSSGASLSFSTALGSYTRIGNIVIATGEVIYPVTANGSAAIIGGLPFLSNAAAQNRSGIVSYTTVATLSNCLVNTNATTFQLYTTTGGNVTNATMSSSTNFFLLIYLL